MTLEQLKERLKVVEEKMARLENKDAYLDELNKYFHLGMVGGSGNRRNINRLNKKREQNIEKTIDRAKEYVELAKERDDLLRQIEYIESGRKERAEKVRQLLQEQVRNAKPGDTVIDSAFGEVKVVRVNKKSITIETKSGYREARPFELIVCVVKRESEEN